jgi:hypothetical protein
MILETKQTTVAYRCPHCGSGVMSAVNPFLLKGSMVRLKCSCGNSVMEVQPAEAGKIRLTVPCIICPKPHHFTVTEGVFYGQELFAFPCPYTDLNICVLGEINHVKAELARTELELLDLMEKNGIESFAALHSEAEQTVTDPQVLDIVLYVIRDLDEEGKIFCRCAPEEAHEYDAEILPEGVRVSCKKCGASHTVMTDSLVGAHEFLHCDALYLK